MAFTVCDVPIYSLSTAMTDFLPERAALIARGRFHSFLGILTVMVVTVPLTGALTNVLGGNAHLAWLAAAALFSVAALFFMRPIISRAQERFIDQSSKPITLREITRYLSSNKYLLIFYGALILSSLTSTTTVLPLYFTNINLGDNNLYVVVVVATMIGSPFVSLLLPRINRRFDKFHIYMFGLGVTIVSSVVSYFVGYEGVRFIPFLIVSALKGIGFSCSTVMSYMFSADCIEYGAYKSGKRAEGVTFSIQTFTTKMTGAVPGFVAMGLLGWVFNYQSSYYVNNALVSPQQPLSAVKGIWFMFSFFPAIGAVLSFVVLLLFYKLRDKDVQIMADVNTGKISREEGRQLLKGEIK
jgi:probable glucitol transport protein GutA